MYFRTQIPIHKTDVTIDYESVIFAMGSCFVENMATKFDYFKLNHLSNPFGVLFHPIAIRKIVTKILKQELFLEDEVFYDNELWHCFDVHSKFSATDKVKVLDTLNQTLLQSKTALDKATHIIITLGTSWAYRYITSKKIVANCHKVSQKEFIKELLTPEQITHSLDHIVSLFPTQKIIFTISPVRHTKDGFFENNLSKSHLFAGLYQVLQAQNVSYFPAYEIVMDELRDYRFFESDMIHPNSVAIDYIWQKFSQYYFSDTSLNTLTEIDSIQKALRHKPFNPETQQHQRFVENTQKRIEKLGKLWR